MDADILIESKDYLYGDDFLEELTKDYQWSSLLDAADASPSEILADAAPVLVPPISPILSVKSCPTESSNSDSGSEDDSKNGSSCTSARQSSQSPYDWLSNFEDEPSNNLKLEDVELFLQKAVPVIASPSPPRNVTPSERVGPVMAIENGVIKGVKIEPKDDELHESVCPPLQSKSINGNGYLQKGYFKVINENVLNIHKDEKQTVFNDQIKLVVEQKKIPSILKRPTLLVKSKTPTIVIPAESTKGGKIAISPLAQSKYNSTNHNNGFPMKVSPPKNGVVLSPIPTHNASASPTTPVVHNVITSSPEHEPPGSPSDVEMSHLSEAEIRAIKKQQRMIKNRESACQSRQKKKEYVTALEQQLLEAHQEIARLRLENKLLRDQVDLNGRGRKIPRLDGSLLIPKKNIAVIFAMVFMVSLNWNVLGWNSKPFVAPTSPQHSSRHLLWSDDNADVNIIPDQIDNSTYSGDCKNGTTKANDYAHINHTESIRIAGELSRWIGSGKTLNWTYDSPRRKRKVYLNEDKINGGFLDTYKLFNRLNEDNLVEFPSTKSSHAKNIKEKSRLRRLRRKELEFGDSAVIDYETLKPRRKPVDFSIDDLSEWTDLLHALKRRDDTFYVVGVGNGEHLLLPAVSHNVTRPPRMALILPARSGNDSVMADHVTLMQIDCSVVNTSLVKLKSDALPESLRKKVDDGMKPAKLDTTYKRGTYLKRNIEESLDAKLSDSLKNSSSNFANKLKQLPTKDNEILRDDSFAQYLYSKYEDSKHEIGDTEKRSMNGSNETVHTKTINKG